MEGTWKLTEYNGLKFERDVAVTFKNGKISYQYGNEYTGNYKIEGNSISFSNFSGTEIACHLTPSDDSVAQAFQTATRWSVDGNTLRLLNDSNNVLLELKH